MTTTATSGTTGPAASDAAVPDSVGAIGGIVRDIARGGFTGMIVGIAGAGIGGRVVMRLAALIVPEAAGGFTTNGNRIGAITAEGSFALALLGLAVGVIAATIWVTVSPWIPGHGLRRALVAMPIAVAIGANGLVDGENQDFLLLHFDPLIVGLLVFLVAAIGFLFAIVDEWLDRRLPPATGPAGAIYWFLAVIGVAVFLPAVVVGLLTSSEAAVVLIGLGLVAVGAATLLSWVRRVEGRPVSSRLRTGARATLVATCAVGLVRVVPEISQALGAG